MTLWTELSDLDFSIRRIQVGEWSTRVLETGTGFPFILMHGTGGHLEAFTKNLRALSADHRVVAYDYPGHGWTTTTTTDLEIDDYIEHLVQLLDVLEIDRAHISGESLGGWVALKFAARHPERVASLVLNTPKNTRSKRSASRPTGFTNTPAGVRRTFSTGVRRRIRSRNGAVSFST